MKKLLLMALVLDILRLVLPIIIVILIVGLLFK